MYELIIFCCCYGCNLVYLKIELPLHPEPEKYNFFEIAVLWVDTI
jgi:hypothetical protein